MADLKIRVFKGDASSPETTVTVPGGVLKIASRLIPKRATDALQERGIDLEEIIKLAEHPDARGTLAEVEDEEEREDRHRSGVASASSAEHLVLAPSGRIRLARCTIKSAELAGGSFGALSGRPIHSYRATASH